MEASHALRLKAPRSEDNRLDTRTTEHDVSWKSRGGVNHGDHTRCRHELRIVSPQLESPSLQSNQESLR